MNHFLRKQKTRFFLLIVFYCCTAITNSFGSNHLKPVLSRKADPDFPVSGRVSDSEDKQLPGVVVSNTRTKYSTVTNVEGGYVIRSRAGDTIRFSMVGFATVNIVANSNKRTVNITLIVANEQLKEVAVTALGIKRDERQLGYSYSEVKGDDINKARDPNFINSLAGRVAGLVITSTAGGPAGSSRVVIRGATSVTGDNQPLYVIDGIPMDNANYGQAGNTKYADGYDMGDAISAINPDDIDKISVLKGASAAALYGSSAANGAILITTKKGKNKKDLGVTYNSTSSFEKPLTKYSGDQYIYGQGLNETLPQDATQALNTLFDNFGPRLDPNLKFTGFDGVVRPYSLVPDNIEGFFRTGSSFTNTVSIASSSDVSSIRFSASDIRVDDIVPTSGIRRNTYNLTGSTKLGKKLTFDTRVFYLRETVDNRPALADNSSNIGNSFIGLANNVDQAYFKTHYQDALGQYVDWGGGQYHLDPYWVINRMKNVTQKDRLQGSIEATYAFTDWLNLQARASTDLTYFNFQNFIPVTTPGNLSGALETEDQKYVTNQADVLLTADRHITKNIDLTARVGGQIYRNDRVGANDLFVDQTVTDVVSPNSYADKSVVANDIKKSKNSVYGLLTAGYKNFLYIDGTIRTDASSTLPKNNNTYTYTSLSGSFVFSDAFNIKDDVLSFGKIRVSTAEVGQDTDPYQLGVYYNLYPFSFQGESIGSIATTILPNPDLKPTRTNSFEVGTELKFFKNRLSFDGSYYTSKSRDQINVVPAPSSSGYTEQVINAGTIANKGVELALSGKIIQGSKINWDMSVNFARNINTVLSLAPGVPYISLADARFLGMSVIAKPGAPYGALYGYNYQRDPSGNIILDPATLAPVPTTDRQVLGKGTYDWTGGLTSTVSYKNWSLSTVLDVKWGAQIFSMTDLLSVIQGSSATTLPGRAAFIQSEEARIAANMTPDQWAAAGNVRGYVPQGVVQTGTDASGKPIYQKNTKAVDPSVYWPEFYSDGNGVAVPFIYNASYIKVRELTLGYTFPKKMFGNSPIKGLSLAFVSRDPFFIYKKVPNIDPDSNYQNGNGQGIEYGSLPSRRSFGFNLNVKF